MGLPTYDRTTQNVGNIVGLEHVNVTVPDLELAALFYVSGLGFTRDPFIDFGDVNIWVNIGSQQVHAPLQDQAQVLRGTVGLVMPDVDMLERRLQTFDNRFRDRFAQTLYAWERDGEFLAVTCPWGNRFRVSPTSDAYNRLQYGIGYVALDVPRGTAPGIALFYRDVFDVPTEVARDGDSSVAVIDIGRGQELRFVETDVPIPDYDGHHVAIYLSNFSGPYERLMQRGLISRETNDHEYRFQDIVDLSSGDVLTTLEHEVRSMYHPMYGRPLVNRNEANSFFETDQFATYDAALDPMVGVHRGGEG